MTTDSIQDLVKRLRAIDHTSVEDCFLQSPYFHKAADALEAMAGEVVDLKKRLDIAQRWPTFSSAREAAEAAEAERDRLKAALELIAVVDQGCGGNLTFEEMARSAMQQARKALGGDA